METGRRSFLSSIVVTLVGVKGQFAAQSQIARRFGILQAGAAAADLKIRVISRSTGDPRQHCLHLLLLVSRRRADIEVVVSDLRLSVGLGRRRRRLVRRRCRLRGLIRRLRGNQRRDERDKTYKSERAKHGGIVLKRAIQPPACELEPEPTRETANSRCYNRRMANLTLVYGMRLLPADDIVEVGEAPVKLKNGRTAQVTMHVLEGSKADIEKQLQQSLDAFFELYPEI